MYVEQSGAGQAPARYYYATLGVSYLYLHLYWLYSSHLLYIILTEDIYFAKKSNAW